MEIQKHKGKGEAEKETTEMKEQVNKNRDFTTTQHRRR
jgi:hypothetical protein